MANQVLPVSSSRPAPDGSDNFLHRTPNGVMNIIQAAFRVGQTGQQPIGLVQRIAWSITRKSQEIYQIEAIPDTIFGFAGGATDLTKTGQYTSGVSYFPGEPVEIVPGFQEPISIELNRAVMNSGTAMEALLNTGDAAEYAAYTGGVGYDPFDTTFKDNGGSGAPTRAITPLQQVRPFNVFTLFYSPTQVSEVIYGIKFVDCWITEVGGWEIDATGDGAIVETITMRCPKIRLSQ